MATKHTSNYQLHLWEPGDSFLREEFNENSEKVDGALGEQKARSDLLELQLQSSGSVTGFYTGTCNIGIGGEQTQQISLGFRPKAVLVAGVHTTTNSQTCGTYNSFALTDRAGGNLSVTDDGFAATSPWSANGNIRYPSMNNQSITYCYIAFR